MDKCHFFIPPPSESCGTAGREKQKLGEISVKTESIPFLYIGIVVETCDHGTNNKC